jgi:hypothetical protein
MLAMVRLNPPLEVAYPLGLEARIVAITDEVFVEAAFVGIFRHRRNRAIVRSGHPSSDWD